MFKKLVLMCILAVVMCPVANATVVSSNFSVGLGYTLNQGWNVAETMNANTDTHIGEFHFVPTVSGVQGTTGGFLFTDRVPTGSGGGVGMDDATNPLTIVLNAVYSGVAQPGGILTVTITKMSIYGTAWGGTGTMWFNETTAGHTSSSPAAAVSGTAPELTNPDAYTQLVWSPDNYQVTGISATRSFGFDFANTPYDLVFLDGFEIEGYLTYGDAIPEPATMILLSLGGLLIRKR